MDIKAYFTKVRRIEDEFQSLHVVMVSLATQDGGREGVMTEVRRDMAARLIADGKARSATPEEAATFYRQMKDAVEKRELEDMRQRVQLILPDDQAAHLRKQIKKLEE